MTYDEIHPTLRRWLGGYEALRKLRYEPDEITCAIMRNGTGTLSCFVQLKVGDDQFLMDAGPIGMAPPLFHDQWTRVAAAVNSGEVSQADLDRIWRESEPCKRSVDFVAALMAKGFNPAARRGS